MFLDPTIAAYLSRPGTVKGWTRLGWFHWFGRFTPQESADWCAGVGYDWESRFSSEEWLTYMRGYQRVAWLRWVFED